MDIRTDPRYELFVASHPEALVFHQPGWLHALQAESGMELVVLGYLDEAGNLEAAMPLMQTRGLPFDIGAQQIGSRLACLPRTPAAGPVFTHTAAAILLLQAAAEAARARGNLLLQIKCALELPADQAEGFVSVKWQPTYVLPIPSQEEQLFTDARTRHKLKWAVKSAQCKGLRVRTAESGEELRSWYPLYLQTMRRNVAPPRPLRFFLALWEGLFPRGMMQLQLAERREGTKHRPVAGAIFLRFRQTVWYAFSGAAEKDLRLHGNDLILWHAIHQACGTEARWMDLGEVPEEHPELVRFKTKWGARPTAQYRYYGAPAAGRAGRICLSPLRAKFFRQGWHLLPLGLTARLGDWVYRRL
jgi:Acetyltransferase (GNAT) domain